MKVGFFTVFRKDPQHYPLAETLLASVRQIMPNVQVTQFTDEKSPAVRGVDDVIRKPNGKMLERRLEHYADCQGEWLLVDTDVLIKRDVRNVPQAGFVGSLLWLGWMIVTGIFLLRRSNSE